jgi:hypothetical protein
MSDELLKALGKAGRDERAAAKAEVQDVPALDEVARERMVQAALDELGPRGAARAAQAPRRAAFGTRRAAVAAAIALAAGILLFVGLRKNTLPPYTLSVQGGTSEWRGDDAGAARDRIVVRRDGAIEIVVRPDDPVSRRVEARAFATRGTLERALPVAISAQGVVRVAGRADELFGPEAGTAPEQWQIVVIVGEVGDVPASLVAGRDRAGLRRLETSVVVTANTSSP